MADVAKCSSCGRAIIWAVTPSGARIPLDARHATFYYLDSDTPPNAIPLTAEVMRGPRDLFAEVAPETPHVYVSHYISCPQAAEHSKARR